MFVLLKVVLGYAYVQIGEWRVYSQCGSVGFQEQGHHYSGQLHVIYDLSSLLELGHYIGFVNNIIDQVESPLEGMFISDFF